MRHSVTYFAVAALSAPLPCVSAQVPPAFDLGEQVRVTHHCPELGAPPGAPWCEVHTGTVEVISADSLVLTLAAQGTRLSVPVALMLGLMNWGECEPGRALEWQACGVGFKELAAAIGVFGGAGAIVGSVVGALVKSERWEEVPLDRLRVSIAPQRDGRFALGMSVVF
jgi:hypothetical protein